jgi:hypothetical protein
MPADPVRRSAARVATLVAVPVAVVAGAISLWSAGVFDSAAPSATPPSASPRPQATSPVAVTARDLAPDAAAVCRLVIARLPDQVGGLNRRPVTAGAEQNAAYGEPPVMLACGATQPSFPPTAQVNRLSGVCWYAQISDSGTAWTTIDRRVPVSVTVPGPQAGSAQAVIPFSAAIAAHDPPADTIPSGCTP